MAGIISVSRKDLAQRRQKLRRQRRLKIVQRIWQTLAVGSMASGLFWATVQPVWVLKTPSQIVMRLDNKLLSPQTVESLLPMVYPQSLWRIQPSAIAETLEKQPAIAQATVNRRMFPPGLIIEIEEKLPVAITQTLPQQNNNCKTQSNSSTSSCEKNQTALAQKDNLSVLDATGTVIPWKQYRVINPNGKLPNLKVIGIPEQYRLYWNPLYQAILNSSLQVTEINCQDPTNLILKTELGNVHLGVPTQLTEKFNVLVQIRQSPDKFDFQETAYAYIDLKNPYQPLVQMK
jgi:cell division protein FtsQ